MVRSDERAPDGEGADARRPRPRVGAAGRQRRGGAAEEVVALRQERLELEVGHLDKVGARWVEAELAREHPGDALRGVGVGLRRRGRRRGVVAADAGVVAADAADAAAAEVEASASAASSM